MLDPLRHLHYNSHPIVKSWTYLIPHSWTIPNFESLQKCQSCISDEAPHLFFVTFYGASSGSKLFAKVIIGLKKCPPLACTELTLSLPNITVVPYANSLDPDETPSNLASHPDPSCLTLRQHFHQLWATLKHFENWSRREMLQTIIYLAG